MPRKKKVKNKRLEVDEGRRDFILGAATCAALGAGSLIIGSNLFAKADVPHSDEFEELSRYNVKPARYFERLDNQQVKCMLCPHGCVLGHGGIGTCQARKNIDGNLYTKTYGNPCAVHIDPIEKKPMFHFLPSSTAYSIGTAGCNLRCLNCQNWQISQSSPDQTQNVELQPANLLQKAKEAGSKSIAYTYNEPIVFYEYMVDSAKVARENGLKNVWVTAGYINDIPLESLCKQLDGANVDLKSFNEKTYMSLNGARLAPVLKTLKTLHKMGVWFEITNLIVPTWTDDLDEITQMYQWIYKNLGPDYPVHVSRFIPKYKLTKLPPTPKDVLISIKKIAHEQGINHAYLGNASELGLEDTICPGCDAVLIKRIGYKVLENNLDDGYCRRCGRMIPGVWS